MNIQKIKENARKNMKGFCRACPICDGKACAGEVPGMGGVGTGESFKSNIRDLKEIKLNLKTIHNAKNPDLNYEIFGKKLDMPVMVAPVTGTYYNMGGYLTEEEYINDIIRGSLDEGILPMIGDSADPTLFHKGISELEKVDGKGIGIIKPRINKDIIKLIELSESSGLIGVGIDIDGAGLITMALKNAPVEPKTIGELLELRNSTQLPFILKGIMTVEEAILAVEIGADAIVVSNHGGRVLDHTKSTAKVLKEIVEEVGNDIEVLVDGGIRTGVDVFKMLALGADAVLLGRPITIASFGGRKDGVKLVLNNIKKELYQAMILTGAKDLDSINIDMIEVPWL